MLSCITPPPGALTRKRYLLRFAQDAADLRAVQRLRFEVFNLELGEGLDSAYALGRDEDVYDDACHHLMVIERDAGVVGTYRMQTAAIARAGRGFYAATEFDLSPLQADVLEQGVEVGRACIAAEHRSGRVLSLLWQGLAHYMSWQQKRYLFGCCSVPAISKAVGRDLFQALQGREGLFSPHTVRPLPDLDCRMADDLTDDLAEDVTPLAPLPPLFEGYLRMGAQVCGPPAIDPLFKTVDFFMLLDLHRLAPRAQRFFRSPPWTDTIPAQTESFAI